MKILCCPSCQLSHCCKHGFYFRKGFTFRHKDTLSTPVLPVKVARFRCLNPDCLRCTFSVLPPGIMPYCRFYWADLLDIHFSRLSGASLYSLAKQVWNVGSAAIRRAMLLLNILTPWITSQHQEVTNGLPARGLAQMVKIITAKLGRHQMVHRWYRHRYPRRFFEQKHQPHNSSLN